LKNDNSQLQLNISQWSENFNDIKLKIALLIHKAREEYEESMTRL
jgi:hypothetical protein